MGGGWAGALYLESTLPLLSPAVARGEAALIAALLRPAPGARVLDVACGHGRHLAALAGRGLALAGVDSDALSLRLAAAAGTGAQLVRADLRALPFGAAFDAAYAWYSSLFLWDDPANVAALAEVARVLRPGGALLVQHANPARVARAPALDEERLLPGGARVAERARWDAARGVETLTRRLTTADGRVLDGSVSLRYYNPIEWREVAGRAGLRLRALSSTGAAGPEPHVEEALDLIAVLEKPT